jgi:hypothetical protein
MPSTPSTNIFNHRLSKRLNFSLEINSKIQLLLTGIDNYKGQWSGNKNLSSQFLKRLSNSIMLTNKEGNSRYFSVGLIFFDNLE